MFRLLGFLVGSVTALIIILFILGVPDFHLSDPETDQKRFDAAVKMLKEKQRQVAQGADNAVGESTVSVIDTEDKVAPVTEEVMPGEGPAQPAAESSAHRERGAPPRETDSAGDLPAVPEELKWYSFWNPFRTKIAARGFVSRLEKVTGLDYRIVKVKSGVYEVAFAYGNDAERRTKLSQISAATGLDLPDS